MVKYDAVLKLHWYRGLGYTDRLTLTYDNLWI